MKILLYGYNGHFNFGDDLLLQLAYDRINSDCAKVTITTTNEQGVQYLKKWFQEAHIIYHPSPGRLFHKYDKVLYVGGNLIFNYNESPGLKLILKKKISMLKIFAFAKLMGTKFAAISLGIGPFNSKPLEKTLLRPLKYFDLLLVRDDKSLNYAKKYGTSNSIIKKYSDLSMSIFNDLKKIKTKAINKTETILIIVRSINLIEIDNNYVKTLVEFSDKQKLNGKKIIWCSLQKSYDDMAINVIPDTDNFWQWNPEKMQLSDFYKLINSVDFVITSRMHGLFISGMLNKKTIGIRLHYKFDVAASIFGENIVNVSPSIDLKGLLDTYNLIENRSKSHNENDDVISKEANEASEAYNTVAMWLNR